MATITPAVPSLDLLSATVTIYNGRTGEAIETLTVPEPSGVWCETYNRVMWPDRQAQPPRPLAPA